VSAHSCRWLLLTLPFLVYAETTLATEAQEKLIRGLWTLTKQAGPIRPGDVQRALNINPSHYVSNPGSQPWDTTYSLTDHYRNETASVDSVADIDIGLGEIVILEGAPRDVGTRQKVKIALKSGECVSTESVQAISHAASAATPLQFENDTRQTKSSLELDTDCATSVLIYSTSVTWEVCTIASAEEMSDVGARIEAREGI
jgi:hypothetical protein